MNNFLIHIAKRIKGDLHNDFNTCIYCGKCQGCKAKAITVDYKEKVWSWKDEKCVRCGHCISLCPSKSLGFKK